MIYIINVCMQGPALLHQERCSDKFPILNPFKSVRSRLILLYLDPAVLKTMALIPKEKQHIGYFGGPGKAGKNMRQKA